MTSLEHRQLKGITIKNIIVTILSTASIVFSVVTTYFELKGDIRDVKTTQDAQNRVNEIRLKVLEGQVALLQREVQEIKNDKN